MAPPARYWDSDCMVGWLAKESDKVDLCRPVIRAAERGDLLIVTSSLTLTEVIKLKRRTQFTREKSEMIRDFFKNPYIVVRELNRPTAELARELIWDHGFDPKDSVHVATAVRAKVDQLDTFDGDLLKKSEAIGNPPLVIGKPNLPEQLEMEADDEGA